MADELDKEVKLGEEPVGFDPIAEAPVGEQEVKKEAPVNPSVEEENKVPYSRFKKFHDRALELEIEAEQARRDAIEWRQRAETYKPKEAGDELPAEWKELYGDTEASKRFYKIEMKRQEALMEKAEERAIATLEKRREQEEAQNAQNIKDIDDGMETLSAYVGRDLTEKEESAILDIVDEYTPKGEDGKYLGALMPFEKAWEIYEMKNQVSKLPKQKSRDNVAALTGSRTQGEPGGEKDESTPSWGDWRKMI